MGAVTSSFDRLQIGKIQQKQFQEWAYDESLRMITRVNPFSFENLTDLRQGAHISLLFDQEEENTPSLLAHILRVSRTNDEPSCTSNVRVEELGTFRKAKYIKCEWEFIKEKN